MQELSVETLIEQSHQHLNHYFGYKSFRALQKEIIEAVYEQQDVLVLMPTGGGKSLCYQIPALTLKGVTLVISPLISLMQDQVDALKKCDVRAEYLNSSQSLSQQQTIGEKCLLGKIDILYVSPEKVQTPRFEVLIESLNINLVAIDEAHCISSWGHDFRPEYTQLGRLRHKLKNVPFMALTATADKMTRKDIVEQLGLNSIKEFLSSFNRPNLNLEVRYADKRVQQILSFIQERPNQSGIIYTFSRKSVEKLASQLQKNGVSCAYYHAGMSSEDRQKVQRDFIEDNVEIICATIAFGMGIDKSSVRWVIHYNLPKNIESFYQEIGRAGRDGLQSDTLLFYSFADVILLRKIIEQTPNSEIYLSKLERMREYAEGVICRRKFLLAYFDEQLKEECHSCDICRNPPEYFEATIAVQKVLSIVARLQQRVGLPTVIDVLLGNSSKNVLERHLYKVKTYGQGKEYSQEKWRKLIRQMIHFGFLDISYDQYQHLKLNELSRSILLGKKTVQLIKEKGVEKKKNTYSPYQQDRSFFEKLREIRMEVARQEGVPPYMIFSDVSLEEMTTYLPITENQMLDISGVGQYKLKHYAPPFMEAIIEHRKENANR